MKVTQEMLDSLCDLPRSERAEVIRRMLGEDPRLRQDVKSQFHRRGEHDIYYLRTKLRHAHENLDKCLVYAEALSKPDVARRVNEMNATIEEIGEELELSKLGPSPTAVRFETPPESLWPWGSGPRVVRAAA